jgi:hypothetical protein
MKTGGMVFDKNTSGPVVSPAEKLFHIAVHIHLCITVEYSYTL